MASDRLHSKGRQFKEFVSVVKSRCLSMPDNGFKLLALPDELLLEILSFCSVEDIARLEMVSWSHHVSMELSLNAT